MNSDKIILICTNNLVPERVLHRVVDTALTQASSRLHVRVVVVSHYPVLEQFYRVDLPDVPCEKHDQFDALLIKKPIIDQSDYDCPCVNFVVGEREYSLHTIFRQMLFAIEKFDTYFIIMEHDVFYPRDYTSKMICHAQPWYDFLYWKNTVFLNGEGYFHYNMCCLSRFAGTQKAWIRFLNSKLSQQDCFTTEPIFKGHEPPVMKPSDVVFDSFKVIDDGDPTLDIKHGFNTTGMMLTRVARDEDPYWGGADFWWNFVDEEWQEARTRMSQYSYGLLLT